VPLGGEDLFPSVASTAASPASPPSPGQLPPYLPKSLCEKILFIGKARIILHQKGSEDHIPTAPSNVWQRLHRALVSPQAVFSIVRSSLVTPPLTYSRAFSGGGRASD
jgi:hypothetical protein